MLLPSNHLQLPTFLSILFMLNDQEVFNPRYICSVATLTDYVMI